VVLASRVDLPPSVRSVGGLLSSARPLTGAWQRGVTFLGSACLGPEGQVYCPPSPTPKTKSAPGDVASFDPIGIILGVECTTLSRDRAESIAADALDATREWQLGQELQTGALTANPSFADAVALPAATDIVEALAALEQDVADSIFGRLAYIHASPANMTRLLAAQAIWRDGRTWRTASGNTVVSSPGYTMAALVATPEVWAATGERDYLTDVDRSVNTTTSYAEEVGIVAFDPCYIASVTVTVA
jgi:hypothetical protein